MNLNLSKLYSWSVVFEPMLFFVILHQTKLGFNGNISRLLQAIFLVVFVINALTKRNKTMLPSLMNERFRGFVLYFILSIVGTILSIASYHLFLDARVVEEYIAILNRFQGRMVFEYIVFIYYIIYFIYLPLIVFKSKKDLNYFFKVFFIVFNISLFFEIVDFYFSFTDLGFISRHLHEHLAGEPIMVGPRFHGFAGEPRDAFVFLALGLALYYVKSIFQGRPQNAYYYLVIIVCMLLTCLLYTSDAADE